MLRETVIAMGTGTQRVIEARLTARGRLDKVAASLELYVGTSTRWSQKLAASRAVLRLWRMVIADEVTAVLQGVKYE